MAGQIRAENLAQRRQRLGLLQRLAELAPGVLVGDCIGQVQAQKTREGKAVQNLEGRGLVRELTEPLENQNLAEKQAGIGRTSARPLGDNRREAAVEPRLENLPLDDRIETLQRVPLLGNLG